MKASTELAASLIAVGLVAGGCAAAPSEQTSKEPTVGQESGEFDEPQQPAESTMPTNEPQVPAHHRKGWRVGELESVPIIDSISGEATDDCFLHIAGKLSLKGGDMIYHATGEGGTECSDGMVVNITKARAKAQDKIYRTYIVRKDEITEQVEDMYKVSGTPVEARGDWVTLVNPWAAHDTHEDITYGDSCIANGQAEKIGQLASGETVVRITESDEAGNSCPPNAAYLQ